MDHYSREGLAFWYQYAGQLLVDAQLPRIQADCCMCGSTQDVIEAAPGSVSRHRPIVQPLCLPCRAMKKKHASLHTGRDSAGFYKCAILVTPTGSTTTLKFKAPAGITVSAEATDPFVFRLLLDPPPPPFLLIWFGNGPDAMSELRVSTDSYTVYVGGSGMGYGPGPVAVRPQVLRDGLALLAGVDDKVLREADQSAALFYTRQPGWEDAGRRLSALEAEHPDLAGIMAGLPLPGSPERDLLRRVQRALTPKESVKPQEPADVL